MGDCSQASRSRGRACTAPAFNGLPCLGEHLETEQCDMNCPGGCFFPSGKCSYKNYGIILEWTEWAPWSSCSVSCGGGQRSRDRNCTLDSDSNGLFARMGSERMSSIGGWPTGILTGPSRWKMLLNPFPNSVSINDIAQLPIFASNGLVHFLIFASNDLPW